MTSRRRGSRGSPRRGRGLRAVVAIACIIATPLISPTVAEAGVRSIELTVPDPVMPDAPRAFLVNNNGDVAGLGRSPISPVPALYWSPPASPRVFYSPSGQDLNPIAMNDAGQIVGGDNLLPTYALFWDPVDGFAYIGSFGGQSYPTDIDERGRVVGFSSPTGYNRQDPSDDRAFIWDRVGGMRSLGTLGDWSRAFVIDESGVVAGLFGDGDALHVFRWTEPTGMVDLGVLAKPPPVVAVREAGHGIGVNWIERIAADGSIYGAFQHWGTGHVFRWSPLKAIEQWTVPGPNVHVLGVSDAGQWAGYINAGTPEPRAVVWTPEGGLVEIAPAARVSSPAGINARGDVVLTADDEGYLWNADRGLIPLNDGRGRIGPTAISDNGYITGLVEPSNLNVEGPQPFLLRLHLEPLAPGSVSAVVAPANVTVSWSAPPLPEGDDPATAYRIYRDDIFIGAVDASTTSFVDHDPLVGIHTYTVIAENAFGQSRASAPATVIVTTTVRGIAVTPTATPVAASPTFAG